MGEFGTKQVGWWNFVDAEGVGGSLRGLKNPDEKRVDLMSQLFTGIALRGVELANRIAVSPMCQYMAEEGCATAWHMIHLGGLASSGAGMMCLEATAVEAEGRITPGDLGLYDDATEAALRPVIAAIRAFSRIKIFMQLGHAGRKAACAVPWQGGVQLTKEQGGWPTVAPSAVCYTDGEVLPVALDEAGLARIKTAFVATAKRAEALGLDGLELHAAHGYLLHQFLSPLANRRTDGYGGTLENRMRFPLEVFAAVRDVFPADKPVGVRVSATDWVEGGWDLEQTIAFAKALKALGVDWIDASSGGMSPAQTIAVGPNYQVPFAKAIKAATGLPTFAVGLITEPQQAEAIVASGQADIVALARAMLYDPRWGWHAAAALGAQVVAPPAYWRAAPHGVKNLFDTTL